MPVSDFRQIAIRKKARQKHQMVGCSPLVMFEFQLFFFVFCNFVLCDKKDTPERKNCPMRIAILRILMP